MIETIPVLNYQQFEAPLGDSIIPSVQGEFYAYTSLFTLNKPLYCLMKCKSNKKRPVDDLPVLGSEVNFLFNFCENKVELY